MINPKIVIYSLAILTISCSQKRTTEVNYREKSESSNNYQILYESGNWNHPEYGKAFESFGNQRVVIEVSQGVNGNVQTILPWRRRDDFPEQKDIVIVDAETNTVVDQKHILEINNEFGHLIFKPNNQSDLYHVYFLPHSSTGSYYPKLTYNNPPETLENPWLSEVELDSEQVSKLPMAKIVSLQSIDDFHSVFPMEVISTKEEAFNFLDKDKKSFYLFPEYRDYPIRMQDYLPVRWTSSPEDINALTDDVLRGEYYTFQVGVHSPTETIEDIVIEFSDFEDSKGNIISKELLTCFNKGGIDLNGKPFGKTVGVESGKTQALWFGIEIPEAVGEGTFTGEVIITPKGAISDTVFVKLNVSSEVIENYGDDDPRNMSRLRWLNSTIGTDKEAIIEPFTPIIVSNKTISILGRSIELNEFGLPKVISSYFTQEMNKLKEDKENILAKSIQFDVINKDGSAVQWNSNEYVVNQQSQSAANWNSSSSSDDYTLNISGTIEYDGMIDYKIKLIAQKDGNVNDIKLQIPMQKEATKYILGLGFKGSKRNENINWKWDITKHQEGTWLGNINKGIQFVLRDENYERPLNTNFYQTKPLNLPTSWGNENKGGINITSKDGYVNVENYSGERSVDKGDTLNFNIRLLITPFKLLDTKEHFNTRFVHKYVPVDSVIKLNGSIVNIHHANEINPYINYPFYNLELQKAYIEEAHSKGIRVKLYNTIREITYKSHELFALKSLGDEILNDGKGGGHSWLQEHFKSNYHSAWHATNVNDAAILNKGTSRWTNYYIEGINWLAKNQEIDGLYLDDIAFSRATVKRIASVFNKHRDSFVIDLHSANQFNHNDGFTNSAFLYMEHFPFISRLWFGEYFEYDMKPDYWMTEVSGIPFGLNGEMLEKGGHPYRGMVYGMTTRVYGNYDPGALWGLFNDFGIADGEMLGYWVERSPIKTKHENIKSTIYINGEEVLIAIGSWSNNNENVQLEIDWQKLGFDKGNYQLVSPEIAGLQKFKAFDLNKAVQVEKNQGLILLLKKE